MKKQWKLIQRLFPSTVSTHLHKDKDAEGEKQRRDPAFSRHTFSAHLN